MSSRVLTGSKVSRAETMHWLTAYGTPVNASMHGDPGGESESGPGPGSKGDLESALQRIQVLERRIHELEAELPRRQEQGRQQGRAEGEQAGTAAAMKQWQPLMDRLAQTVGDLSTYRARFRRDSEPELLRLALAVAKKILRRELTVDPHSLLGILRSALETISSAEILSVRTAPEEAGLLVGKLEKLGLPAQVEVIPDRSLERGSVVIDTRRGQVDASVHTQLAEIENGFADRIGAGRTK